MKTVLSLFVLGTVAFAARITDYSTDMVVLESGQTVQTLKLYVSGPRSRVEGFTAGTLGRIVTIARKDRGVTWTLYPDRREYSETPLNSSPGKPDLANFDLANVKKEVLGRETVLGYACTKMRAAVGNLPNGRPLTATVWVADSLELPVRMDVMGFVQENRNLRPGPQPAALFEIPAGYNRTGAPGRPAGVVPSPRAYQGGAPAATAPVAAPAAPRQPVRPAAAASMAKATAATTVANANAPAWKLNTNYPGGDYRSIDMATSDPTACKAACDKDAPCKAWTLVKPGEPGGMGYCWLKDSVPPEIREDCCISGLKGAGGTATGGQVSKYPSEMNTNRYGDDYRDFVPAKASADICAEACVKDARCRAWTWVKNDLEPPTGHCWLKNRVPDRTPDDCCVSGLRK